MMLPNDPTATAVTYIKVEKAKEERWIAFDEDKDKSEVINPKVLVAQVAEMQKQLDSLPIIDEKELLEWAKVNYYPYAQAVRDRERLQNDIDQIKAILKEIGVK